MDRTALTYLYELNQSMDRAIAMLGKLSEYPEMRQRDIFLIIPVYLREHLADANMLVFETMLESEEKEMDAAYFKRSDHEKSIRDPDDCYLEVARREEERRKQGLPPMLGTLLGMRRITMEEILAKPVVDPGEDDENSTEEGEAEGGAQ